MTRLASCEEANCNKHKRQNKKTCICNLPLVIFGRIYFGWELSEKQIRLSRIISEERKKDISINDKNVMDVFFPVSNIPRIVNNCSSERHIFPALLLHFLILKSSIGYRPRVFEDWCRFFSNAYHYLLGGRWQHEWKIMWERFGLQNDS